MLEDYVRIRKFYPKKEKAKAPSDKPTSKPKIKAEQDTGVMYSQETIVAGTNGKIYANIKCHRCDKYGHYFSHCPDENGN